MSSTEVECPLNHVKIWSPTSKPRKWLLIAGTSNPPENIVVSGRRPREPPTARSGKYLSGVNFDLAHMGRAVETELHNILRDFEMTKNDAIKRIRKFFEFCLRGNFKPMLYYTGHGEEDTGNWCFQDGTIGIDKIFSMCPTNMEYPTIITDACFSGHWVNYAHEKLVKGFQCLSACGAEETALDTGEGGDFTCYLCGKNGKPQRIPHFSGIEGCTLKDGGYKYEELIEVLHSAKNENTLRPINLDNWRLPLKKKLITQSVRGQYLYSIIEEFKNGNIGRSVVGLSGTWEQVRGVIQNRYNNKNCKERFVYSLQADSETDIFYVIMVSDFGSEQIIVTFENTYDVVAPNDFMITSCTSAGGKYQLVLTKRTCQSEYEKWILRMGQEVQTINKNECNDFSSGRNKKDLTSICYNKSKKEYLAVTADIWKRYTFSDPTKKAEYQWFSSWKHAKMGFSVLTDDADIIFSDPTDGSFLCVANYFTFLPSLISTEACLSCYKLQ